MSKRINDPLEAVAGVVKKSKSAPDFAANDLAAILAHGKHVTNADLSDMESFAKRFGDNPHTVSYVNAGAAGELGPHYLYNAGGKTYKIGASAWKDRIKTIRGELEDNALIDALKEHGGETWKNANLTKTQNGFAITGHPSLPDGTIVPKSELVRHGAALDQAKQVAEAYGHTGFKPGMLKGADAINFTLATGEAVPMHYAQLAQLAGKLDAHKANVQSLAAELSKYRPDVKIAPSKLGFATYTLGDKTGPIAVEDLAKRVEALRKQAGNAELEKAAARLSGVRGDSPRISAATLFGKPEELVKATKSTASESLLDQPEYSAYTLTEKPEAVVPAPTPEAPSKYKKRPKPGELRSKKE